MVIVKIIGGLGNQLFQYAAAKRAAYMNDVQLKLDIIFFNDFPNDIYRLNHYNIVENIASSEEVLQFKSKMENGKFFNLNLKCFNRANSDNIAYLKEKPFTYTKSINQNMKDIYLEGYWQNERYFNDIKLLIKKEFTLKHQISHESLNLKKMMEDCNSVSIHVRKGDYVGNPFFKECSANYYKNAINYILNKVDTPHFFIFSDSIESLRNYNFPGKVTFVNNHSLRRDYEDLLLMSRCKHNIIANSTFSWWAAWLNDNKDKIVISPLNWYSKKRNNKLIKKYGLIPKAWITV